MKKVIKTILGYIDIPIMAAILYVKLTDFNKELLLTPQVKLDLYYGCLGSALIVISVLCIFNLKGRMKAFFVLDFLVSMLLITDIVYNRYFHDVTSIALIKQAALVGEVSDSVKALIHINDFVYMVDLLILIPAYMLIRKKINFRSKIYVRLISFVLVFAAGFMMAQKSVNALNADQPGLLNTFYDKKYIVGAVGELNFHGFDIARYFDNHILKAEKLSTADMEQIKEWYDDKNKPVSVKYNSSMKGKNLIIVQLESFQGFVLGAKINGQEITPNLNKISKDSLTFTNYHYQTAWGGTSDAEFLSNISLLPARDGSVYYQYSGNTYDSMIKELEKMGYFTSVMHANRPGFWNRAAMYKDIGFDKYENENDFNIDDIQGLGLSDKSFLHQAVIKMAAYNQPFYSFLITLSSHFPFKDSNDKLKNILDVGQFEGQMMGDYLKSVKYTDEALGQLVDDLKANGLWDSSVVVFYGDHSAIPQDKEDQLAEFLYNRKDMSELEWFNAQKVVMMVHFPGEKIKGVNSMMAGQMDLYPTIANLYGFDAKYTLGRDLLNSDNGFVVTRDGVWADNNVAYLKSVDKLVNLKTGQEVDKEGYSDDFKKAEQYLKYSDATIEHDLLCYFEKDKTN